MEKVCENRNKIGRKRKKWGMEMKEQTGGKKRGKIQGDKVPYFSP